MEKSNITKKKNNSAVRSEEHRAVGHNVPPENLSAFRIPISTLTDKFLSIFYTKYKLCTSKYASSMQYTPKLARGRRNGNSKSTKIFSLKVMTLQHWVSQYDLTALGFSVMTFLHGGIDVSIF